MSKIRESAYMETCSIRLPGICNGTPETTVLAHINGVRFGHGIAKKTNDIHAAYACSACHDAVDGRTKTSMSKDDLEKAHYQGVFETQLKLMKKGLL